MNILGSFPLGLTGLIPMVGKNSLSEKKSQLGLELESLKSLSREARVVFDGFAGWVAFLTFEDC